MTTSGTGPTRWPKAGPYLKQIGTYLSLLGFGSCKVLGREYHILVVWGSLVVIIGGILVVVGSMLAPADAEKVLQDDARDPILFLRSFSSDKPRFWYRLYSQIFGYGGYSQNVYTPEEVICDILSSFGPFIALGKPGEKISTPGAARMYADDDWKKTLANWLQRAKLVVLQIGDGEGLWWELGRAVQVVNPRSVLLYVPSAKEDKHRDVAYQNFSSKASSIFPNPLPEQIGSSIFIWFDEDWNPIALPFRKLTVRQYIPIALRSRQYKVFVEILISMEPVLKSLSDSEIVVRGLDLKRLTAEPGPQPDRNRASHDPVG